MKKFVTLMLSITLCLSTPCYAKNVANQDLITITYEGKEIEIDRNNPPIIRNDRVLVPFYIFNSLLKDTKELNIESTFDKQKKEVTVVVKGEFNNILGTYTQYVQDYIIYKNNLNCYAGDVRSDYLNKVAFVSIRAFGSALVDDAGDPIFDLAWDKNKRQVVITRYKKSVVSTGGIMDDNNTGQ